MLATEGGLRMEPGDASEPFETQQPLSEPTISELLRTIGSLLDEQERLVPGLEAREGPVDPLREREDGLLQVKMIDHGEFVSIIWRTADRVGNRSLTHAELLELSRMARQTRRGGDHDGAAGWQELMRTLGQLVEAEGVEVRGVFEYEGRFGVAGTADGESGDFSPRSSCEQSVNCAVC